MSDHRVPGEDAPLPVPVGLALLGFAAAFGTATAWTEKAEADVAAPAPSPPPPATVATVAGAAASSNAAAPTPPTCEPLVVLFVSGAQAPPPSATHAIGALGAWLVEHPSRAVVIDGHADSQGSEHANLELSRKRAAAVAQLLVAKGVVRDRMTWRGFGAFSPVEGESDDADTNRRVVVRIRGAGDCPFSKEEVVGR